MNVAIIGYGRSGCDIHGKFFRTENNDICNVVAIVELDPARETSGNGFYYLTAPLDAGADSVPVTSVTYSSAAPTGYTLKVQVLASVIQSDPAAAVQAAWGFNVDEDGNLIINN